MTNESKAYIYALVDPETQERRYIGMTKIPGHRFNAHCNDPQPGSRKYKWIGGLKEKGLLPTMDILEEVGEKENCASREYYWILYGRASGWPLTNSEVDVLSKSHIRNIMRTSFMEKEYPTISFANIKRQNLMLLREPTVAIFGKLQIPIAVIMPLPTPENIERLVEQLREMAEGGK
jgi:hypothetical protein